MKPTDHDPASHTLSNRVTELRKKHKLTLDQLATSSGVSRSMLSQIERGQANPTLTVTFRIAQAFGMSIGELVDQPWASSTIEVVHVPIIDMHVRAADSGAVDFDKNIINAYFWFGHIL